MNTKSDLTWQGCTQLSEHALEPLRGKVLTAKIGAEKQLSLPELKYDINITHSNYLDSLSSVSTAVIGWRFGSHIHKDDSIPPLHHDTRSLLLRSAGDVVKLKRALKPVHTLGRRSLIDFGASDELVEMMAKFRVNIEEVRLRFESNHLISAET